MNSIVYVTNISNDSVLFGDTGSENNQTIPEERRDCVTSLCGSTVILEMDRKGSISDSECFVGSENRKNTLKLVCPDATLRVVEMAGAVAVSEECASVSGNVSALNNSPIKSTSNAIQNSKKLNEREPEKVSKKGIPDEQLCDMLSKETVPYSDSGDICSGKIETEKNHTKEKDISTHGSVKCTNVTTENMQSNVRNIISGVTNDTSLKKTSGTDVPSPRSILSSERGCVSPRSKKIVRFAVLSQEKGENVNKDTISSQPIEQKTVQVSNSQLEKPTKVSSSGSQSMVQNVKKAQESDVENDNMTKELNQNICSSKTGKSGLLPLVEVSNRCTASSASSDMSNTSGASAEIQENDVHSVPSELDALKLPVRKTSDRNVADVNNSKGLDSHDQDECSQIATASSTNVGVTGKNCVSGKEPQLSKSQLNNSDNMSEQDTKNKKASQHSVNIKNDDLTINSVSDKEVCNESSRISPKSEGSLKSPDSSFKPVVDEIVSTPVPFSEVGVNTLSGKEGFDKTCNSGNSNKSLALPKSEIPSEIGLKYAKNKSDSLLSISCTGNEEDNLLTNVNSDKSCTTDSLNKTTLTQLQKPSETSVKSMQIEDELNLSIKNSGENATSTISDKSCNSVRPCKSAASARSQRMSEIVIKPQQNNQNSEFSSVSEDRSPNKMLTNNDAKKIPVVESPFKALTSARSLILSEIALKSVQNSKDSSLSSSCKINSPSKLTSPRKSPIIGTGFPRIVLREKSNKPRKIKRLVLKEKSLKETKDAGKSSEPEQCIIDSQEMPASSSPQKSVSGLSKKEDEVQIPIAPVKNDVLLKLAEVSRAEIDENIRMKQGTMKNDVLLKTAEVSLVKIDESLLIKYGVSSKDNSYAEINSNTEENTLNSLQNVDEELKENAVVNLGQRGKKRKLSQSCLEVSIEEQSAEDKPSAKRTRFSQISEKETDDVNEKNIPILSTSKSKPHKGISRIKNKHIKIINKKIELSQCISPLMKEKSNNLGNSFDIPSHAENLELNLKKVRIHIAKLDPTLLLKYGIKQNELNMTDMIEASESSEKTISIEPVVKEKNPENCNQSNEINAYVDSEALQNTSVNTDSSVPKSPGMFLVSEKDSISTSPNKLRQVRKIFRSSIVKLKLNDTEDFETLLDNPVPISLESKSNKDIPLKNSQKNAKKMRKVSSNEAEVKKAKLLNEASTESRVLINLEEKNCNVNNDSSVPKCSDMFLVSDKGLVSTSPNKLRQVRKNVRSNTVKLKLSDTEDFETPLDKPVQISVEPKINKSIPLKNSPKNVKTIRGKVSSNKTEMKKVKLLDDNASTEGRVCINSDEEHFTENSSTIDSKKSSNSDGTLMSIVDSVSPGLESLPGNPDSVHNIKLHEVDSCNNKDKYSVSKVPACDLKVAVVCLSKIENNELLKYGINCLSKKDTDLNALESKPNKVKNSAVKSISSKRVKHVPLSKVTSESRKRKRNTSCDSSDDESSLSRLLKKLKGSDVNRETKKLKRNV